MRRILSILLAAILLLPVLAGCRGAEETSSSEPETEPLHVSIYQVVTRICENVDVEDLAPATDDELRELFYIDSNDVLDWDIMTTSGRFGAAEVGIFQPVEGKTEDIIASLERRVQDRISQFEDYDVHGALEIANSAEIFEQGDYVVYLMLADTKAAKDIVFEMISTGSGL